MGVNTAKYVKKPLVVDAVRVTEENLEEIAAWCQGEILTDQVAEEAEARRFIKVRVHNPKNPRQTRAFVGDWLLYTERGYKVYTTKAFYASFDPMGEATPSGVFTQNNGAATAEIETELVRPPVETPTVSDFDSAPPPQTTDGQRVLTEAEQREMHPDEVATLLRSGEAVLAQDVV